ncbi:hypothetical protein B0I37DRAFT_371828, partial [Chaetomium sp. MPI-CAGE-AT-0009]
MPPRPINEREITKALRNEALPVLERLAQNPSLLARARARFDLDEPPPFPSSTEDEDEDKAMPNPVLERGGGVMSDELQQRLDEAIDSLESDRPASLLELLQRRSRMYSPRARCTMELKPETWRDRV